jgi:FdrA protein
MTAAADTHVEVRPGAYADSVTLLQVSKDVTSSAAVASAQVAMATPLNLDLLAGVGFDVPPATSNDMVVAVRLSEDGRLEDALAAVDAALAAASHRGDEGPEQVAPPRTTAAGLTHSDAGLVLVSVPGASAFVEAMDAIDAGRDVMVLRPSGQAPWSWVPIVVRPWWAGSDSASPTRYAPVPSVSWLPPAPGANTSCHCSTRPASG